MCSIIEQWQREDAFNFLRANKHLTERQKPLENREQAKEFTSIGELLPIILEKLEAQQCR